ncbi:alpha/beta hydrolase [Methanolobus sediminis]|uniref:Alpha/beta hydrolase n=1 Tax=Methanolobus sediminis TaxID=3072978 RepID=A0AA51UIY6_9EURY|nr:alpha/beta hydrolase [Methanolobus sediminis]WMW24137.1 alpha/beta hydrolase [Methanolobus sediminis]
MKKHDLLIDNIPAVLWGKDSSKLFVAVHGNMSHKKDTPISILSEEAVPLGYQVLSFDLPQHGDRIDETTPCKVQNCVSNLCKIMDYAQANANEISLFACSIGAYFSLLACKEISLHQCLFLSPVVNMERIIENMMTWFNISEEQLKTEEEIPTPAGQTLYWDYYCYVKENPVLRWNSPTALLYGKEDNICEYDIVSSFSNKFNCNLEVMENGEHYFHTPDQLSYYRQWLSEHLCKL